MSERVLITGITGFVGSHLADHVLALGGAREVHGVQRWHRSPRHNVRHIEERVQWHDCDLTDPIAVRDLVERVRPDKVFHCAAESFVSPSWLHPTHYMRTNFDATVHLLDALHYFHLPARIHLPGSGEEYGDIEEARLPITTDTPLCPVNPYAVSKIAQDLIGYVYFRSYGVKVIRTRAFNHEGPRRDRVFGIPWYAYQIARVEAGLQPPLLKVGHIDDRRNFTHVRDMVEAYALAIEKCEPGRLYLIGSEEPGHIHTFRGALERLIDKATVRGIRFEEDPRYVRPTQVPRLIADTAPFRNLTGWRPRLSFEAILDDTLAYWRERVKGARL
ncbi:MAG: GDP-mannose 4,6-dehydratase [Planctomycetes bacterium]|nr:GDP-mannose 4,6-dehydratase [Planctomycetota bacterium]